MKVQFDLDDLRPLVQSIVEEILQRLELTRSALPTNRLAWSEPEAAALLGMLPHVLRDERRRGRISASSVAGRRIRYLRSDLEAYLAARRVEAETATGR